MDPPAGFVHARNPAVAGQRSPVSPEGAHFRASHHSESIGSQRPGRTHSRSRLLGVRPPLVCPQNACGLQRVLEDAEQREFRGVPARAG